MPRSTLFSCLSKFSGLEKKMMVLGGGGVGVNINLFWFYKSVKVARDKPS